MLFSRAGSCECSLPNTFDEGRIVSPLLENRPIRRRTALAGLSAGAVAGLAACSNAGDGKNGGKASGKGGAQSPSTSPEPSTEWTSADASLLETVDVTLNPEAEGKTVTTPRFPKARNLTQATEVVRNRLLREAHWDDIEKVEIKATILAAAQDVVGVAVVGSLGDEADVPCSIWYDARKKQSFAPAALIEAAKWGEFAKAVHDAAGKAKVDASAVDKALIDKSAPYGNGPAMAFNPEGKLVLAFRTGAAGEAPARLVVDAEPFLSDLGKLAKDASAKPAKFTGEPSEELEHFTPKRHVAKPIDSPNRPSDGSEAASPAASDGGQSDGAEGDPVGDWETAEREGSTDRTYEGRPAVGSEDALVAGFFVNFGVVVVLGTAAEAALAHPHVDGDHPAHCCESKECGNADPLDAAGINVEGEEGVNNADDGHEAADEGEDDDVGAHSYLPPWALTRAVSSRLTWTWSIAATSGNFWSKAGRSERIRGSSTKLWRGGGHEVAHSREAP